MPDASVAGLEDVAPGDNFQKSRTNARHRDGAHL